MSTESNGSHAGMARYSDELAGGEPARVIRPGVARESGVCVWRCTRRTRWPGCLGPRWSHFNPCCHRQPRYLASVDLELYQQQTSTTKSTISFAAIIPAGHHRPPHLVPVAFQKAGVASSLLRTAPHLRFNLGSPICDPICGPCLGSFVGLVSLTCAIDDILGLKIQPRFCLQPWL